MDITRHTFHLHLRSMLEDISRAHFVAIDLEFTGIARQQNYNKAKDFKQTLQERYAETRSAAERYQILQVGLTCVMEDRSKSAGLVRFQLTLTDLRRGVCGQALQFPPEPRCRRAVFEGR